MKTETPDLQFCRAVLAVSRLLAAGFFVFVILVYILCFKKCSQPYLFLHFVLFCSTVKSKFYKKRGATFFYDVTRKLGPLDFTQYRSKSSSF